MANLILSLQELSCKEKDNNEKSNSEENSNKRGGYKKSNFTHVDKNNCSQELYPPNHILSLCREKTSRYARVIQHRKKRCANCRRKFYPEKHILNQKYCSKKECQRARNNAWERRKLRNDRDYRERREITKRKWKLLHPGYWKNYKKKIISGEASSIVASRKKRCGKIDFEIPTLEIMIVKDTLNSLRKAKVITCVCKLSCSDL